MLIKVATQLYTVLLNLSYTLSISHRLFFITIIVVIYLDHAKMKLLSFSHLSYGTEITIEDGPT